jgi:hypothetical protein
MSDLPSRPGSGKAKRNAWLTSKAKRDAWLTVLTGFFAVLISILPALAAPTPAEPDVSATGAILPSTYLTVKHLGESDQQAALRQGHLLSHRRATDPFGINIRGPFRGLPPVVEHATPAEAAAARIAAVVNAPTLEKAVDELTIVAVNVGAHEMLIGSRSIREGDLLVLESGGQEFVAWVQSIGVHGVLFSDIDRQKHLLKPFGSGPKELTAHSDSGVSDIRKFLQKDAQP